MVDDELDLVRELFASDDAPLDPATRDRVLDRITAGVAAAADEERGPSNAMAPPHRSGSRRQLMVAVGGMAIAAAVILALLLPTGGDARRGQPSTDTPLHAHTIHFQVTGYTSAQATAAAKQCLAVAGASGPEGTAGKGPALRATFSDALGSVLVVTTTTGFYTCNEALNGTVTLAYPFETYATAEGDGPAPSAPTSTSPPGSPSITPAEAGLAAHWLQVPVELDASGAGAIGKPNPTGWVSYAIGRVAPNIAKVTVQLMEGDTVTAIVENGFFVAREALASAPAIAQGGGTTPVMGYDSSGTLVYDSLTNSWAIAPGRTGPISLPTSFPCFVTPSGQPVTPVPVGQTCQTAVAWGY